MNENLTINDIKPEIAQWAARLPGSTITGVKVIESDTWGVALNEKRRPTHILIGDKSQCYITEDRWPALAAHEAAHSSATYYSPQHEDIAQEFVHAISNIIEDIRIDTAIQKMLPGLTKCYDSIYKHWNETYKQKVECLKNDKIVIESHKTIIEAIVLLKFLGIEKCLEITQFKNQKELITLRNGNKQELNLQSMWFDLIDTTKQYVDVDPRFTASTTIRKEQNKTAVKHINEWLEQYSWVFRNTGQKLELLLEGKQQPGAQMYQEAGNEDSDNKSNGNSKDETKGDDGKRYKIIIEKDATVIKTPELLKPQTPAQQQEKEIQRIKECFKAPGGHGEDASTLGGWADSKEVNKMLPEVFLHFPIIAPRAKSQIDKQLLHKREPHRYGRLSVNQVTRYISNNRPADAPLFERWQHNTVAVPPIYPQPPRGNDFPIKRLALYLDLSGSMTAAVGFMVNWTLAMISFARSQNLTIRVVVGDTGTLEINPQNYHSIDKLMSNPRGGCGNSPTWQTSDMEKTLHWVKGNNDNAGKAIFVTDMAIQEDEQEFIKKTVSQKLGILIPGVTSIKELGDLLWNRKSSTTAVTVEEAS